MKSEPPGSTLRVYIQSACLPVNPSPRRKVVFFYIHTQHTFPNNNPSEFHTIRTHRSKKLRVLPRNHSIFQPTPAQYHSSPRPPPGRSPEKYSNPMIAAPSARSAARCGAAQRRARAYEFGRTRETFKSCQFGASIGHQRPGPCDG